MNEGPGKQAHDPIVLPNGKAVPESAIEHRATTSGGPGGQHANRSMTRVEVRVQVAELPLHASQIQRVRDKLATRITADGVLAASSADSRSQLRNINAARARIAQLLADALHVERTRVKTRPSKAAKERRLQGKKIVGERKKQRRGWKDGSSDS